MSWRPPRPAQQGFTLVEVLTALAIVAIALLAGAQASSALVRNSARQGDMLLAQLCAENALVAVRLSRQMPPLGEHNQACPQAGRSLSTSVFVLPTPNPAFRRVDAQVLDEDQQPLLRLSTIVGRR